jgi:hypothetical protein
MKTSKTTKRSKKRQAGSLPGYPKKSIQFLSPLEIAVFHHFYFTRSDRKSSKAFGLTAEDFHTLLNSSIRKLQHFVELFKDIKEEARLSIYPPTGKSKPIETLGLSSRIRHHLLDAEIHTVGSLSKLTEYELKRIRGINTGSIREIKAALRKHKLKSPLLP